MNILYLCDEYPPTISGGIGSSVKLLAEAMQRSGNNVFVAGLYPSFRKIDSTYVLGNGVKIWKKSYFPIQSKILSKSIINRVFGKYLKYRFLNYLAFLNKIIVENNIQIVEIPDYQEIFFDTYHELIEYKLPVPIVVKTHGSYSYISTLKGNNLDEMLTWKEKSLYNSSSAIICLSQFSRKSISDLYGLENSNKMINIPHGIVMDEAQTLVDPPSIRIIFAGSLTATKGIFQLINAWNIVLKNSKMDLQLDIYGKYNDNIIASLISLIDKANMKTIHFHGHVDKLVLEQAYQKAYVAVLPSYFETFGMVAIEAMSNHCPVIFTNRTSGPEIIQDGINGFLIDPENPKQIAERIIELINNPDLRRKLASNAYKTVSEKFDIDLVVKRHIDLYRKIIG